MEHKSLSWPRSGNHIDPLTLPPEITSQIFFHVVYQEPLPKDGEWCRDFSPLYLGRVCRAWRNFAWSAPELWSTLVLVLGKDADGDDKTNLALLQEWLSRAGSTRDLEIYLEKITGSQYDLPRRPVAMLNLLKPYSTRWSATSLRIPGSWVAFLYGDNTKLSFRCLRSLLFDTVGRIPDELDLTDAPLLNDLTLGNFALHDIQNLLLPMAQITAIHILPTQIELQRQLLCFPNLTEAHFTDVYARIQGIASHSKIQSLHLAFQGEKDLQTLVSALSFPALEKLEIAVLAKAADFMMDIIFPFIFQSQCKLTHLYLKFNISPIDEQDIYEFLTNVPGLKELHINDPFHSTIGLSHIFFDVLHPSWNEPYLPLLEIISYEGPLWLRPQDFLEPLILRAKLFKDGKCNSDGTMVSAVLRSVQIKADQYEVDSEDLPNWPLDPKILRDLQDLIDAKVIELVNRDGMSWKIGEKVCASKGTQEIPSQEIPSQE